MIIIIVVIQMVVVLLFGVILKILINVGNIVINLLTLGLGLPFTQMRVFRFVCDRLSAGGEINIDAIIQNAEKRSGLGEGLADAFDVGAV